MNKKILAIGMAVFLSANMASADGRPNIVVMMTDNQGYGDLDIYGGTRADTPNIDLLASEGVLFKDFQVEPVCVQTRAAFMTGRMPVRSGTDKYVIPGAPGGLHPKEVTLAELMKRAGYATALYGKWHLGETEDRFPHNQGFDEWYGIANTSNPIDPNFPGSTLDEIVPQEILQARAGKQATAVRQLDMEYRGQIDRDLTERSVSYITNNALTGKPFFLFTSFINPHYPVVPHPDFKGKSKGGAYTDVLMEIDYNVGSILRAIEQAGIGDNTIVLLFSDNGATLFHPEPGRNGDNGPWSGELGTAWEGGLRTLAMMRWPGKIQAGWSAKEMVHTMDLFVTLATAAGVAPPSDRPIDGFDQTDYLLGRSAGSARDHRLAFNEGRYLAIRYKQFKAHFVVYDKEEGVAGGPRDLGGIIQLYNLVADPKEEMNLLGVSGGQATAAMVSRQAVPYFRSFTKYPNNDYSKLEHSE